MRANYRHYMLFFLALVAFAGTILGYAYLRNRIYAQAIRGAELSKQVDVLEEKKKHEYDVTTTYSKIADQSALVTNFIISKEKIVEFIEQVEKIGTDTSTELDLTGIESPEITKTSNIEANYTHMKAHIEINGTWANVLRAIVLLENLPYSIGYDNLHLSQESKGDPTGLPVKQVGTTTPAGKPAPVAKKWRATMDVNSLIIP